MVSQALGFDIAGKGVDCWILFHVVKGQMFYKTLHLVKTTWFNKKYRPKVLLENKTTDFGCFSGGLDDFVHGTNLKPFVFCSRCPWKMSEWDTWLYNYHFFCQLYAKEVTDLMYCRLLIFFHVLKSKQHCTCILNIFSNNVLMYNKLASSKLR